MTAAGDVTLRRVYFTCRRCGARARALDERPGVRGFVSPHARRPLCLAGVGQPFEKAARRLRGLAGLVVCDDTVRAACDRHGGAARARRDDPEAGRAFRAADGAVGFRTDGTCVDTTGGWREIRLSVFAKRPRGHPVTDLDDRDERRPPAPEARVAAAAIVSGAAPGPQWRRAAARLGVKRADGVTVPADGAKWIWAEVEKNLPGAAGVLDFYHAGGPIRAATRALHGEGTAAARGWAEARERALLESGAGGLLGAPDGGAAAAEPVAYLEPHRAHTPYRRRPAEGRSIGSGMVEGACESAIGKRLKQTGARRRHRRVERMASLCCLAYGEQRDAYWKKAAG